MVIGAAGRWFDNVNDPQTAEALAAKEGIELAMELGVDRLILEVDCLELDNMLLGSSSVRSSIGSLCFDIRDRQEFF